jgi:hypothetical protein
VGKIRSIQPNDVEAEFSEALKMGQMRGTRPRASLLRCACNALRVRSVAYALRPAERRVANMRMS